MLCVWVETSVESHIWWVIIERQDKSYHWTLPIDKSEGYAFLSMVIETAVLAID